MCRSGSPPDDALPADCDGRHSQVFRVYNARSIGSAIREMRVRQGLTQQALARDLAIPVRYISTLEQGHSTEQLERLLLVLARLDARLTIQEGAPW